MKQSSVVIHKGGNDTKYEICVEDYVVSYLKDETGTLELSEFYFYGYREKNGRRFIIYGAGRDRHLPVFAQYNLLEEIGCRLTQAGPVFLVREKNNLYEAKGYDIFYQDNAQMQRYLIDRKSGQTRNEKAGKGNRDAGNIHTVHKAGYQANQEKTRRMSAVQKAVWHDGPYSLVSVQLGVILVALVAIVINSTNSYDKMEQLNRSAAEVFFAIENQEAEDVEETGGQDEIVVERDMLQAGKVSGEEIPGQEQTDIGQESILELVTLENSDESEKDENLSDIEQAEASGIEADNGEDSTEAESVEGDTQDGEKEPSEEDAEQRDGQTVQEENGESQQEENMEESGRDLSDGEEDEGESGEENIEALSRNVTRYYEVERGDTLYTISQKIYGDESHVKKICELNQITNPDNIRYGQKIILP